jgi:adenosylhomocysteinase
MEGYEVRRIESVLPTADIYVTATGNKDIIMVKHMAQMKNNAIVGNLGHFDNEIDIKGLENYPGVTCMKIKDQVDRYEFPDGHGIILLATGRFIDLGCANGQPSFVMSCLFTTQVLAQIELWNHKANDKYAKGKVTILPQNLDEKVAALHLSSLNAELTILNKDQAEYINVPVEGPFKEPVIR